MSYHYFRTHRERFCLTPVFDSDVKALVNILNNPKVYLQLRTPPFPYTESDAVWYINHCKAEANAGKRAGSPNIAIRRAEGSAESPLLGIVNLKYDVYDRYPEAQQRALSTANALLPPEEAQWVFGCYLDPAEARQGIMKSAAQALIEQWFVPTIKPQPGQLISSCYADNIASRRLHYSLGFLPVATSPKPEIFPESKGGMTKQTICWIWQGAGPVSREESAYADFPKYIEETE